MLRIFGNALRDGAKRVAAVASLPLTASSEVGLISRQSRYLGSFTKQLQLSNNFLGNSLSTSLLSEQISQPVLTSVRHGSGIKKQRLIIPPKNKCVYFSLKNGKRITNKDVVKRFYRLNWGIWIRTIAGRHKHLWRKSPSRRQRSKWHVFTNSTQSFMLDKMVTKFWKRPKYYVDDPYEPYHTRNEFSLTRKVPRPLD
ncbi:39S ribosomal protein L35, mitochondrial [Copidosoma floridanum]|uniref:39S ribosomal protein L35, mitochondrial n=1 Tax=Copidosoma floridanum TaxID=29053 RepID=UPI0006C9807D|nr:39S ribosomal protein L35, mitochondrial [Copidosoma floridanum]